jgi:hypothetical protein
MADATRLTEGVVPLCFFSAAVDALMGTKQPMTETLVNKPSRLRRLSRLYP